MMTTEEIRAELQDVRYYYSRKAMFDRAKACVAKNAAVALAEAASAAENADNEQTIPRDIVAGYCFAIVRGNATLCKLNNACFAGESACFRTYISFQHREKSSKIGICAGVEKVVETVDNSL